MGEWEQRERDRKKELKDEMETPVTINHQWSLGPMASTEALTPFLQSFRSSLPRSRFGGVGDGLKFVASFGILKIWVLFLFLSIFISIQFFFFFVI